MGNRPGVGDVRRSKEAQKSRTERVGMGVPSRTRDSVGPEPS